MNARRLVLAALAEWRRGKRLADAILQQLLGGDLLSTCVRGFATELFYGVLRNLTLLDFWIDRLRSGSLDHASRDLLRLGLYQLFHLHTPVHAAILRNRGTRKPKKSCTDQRRAPNRASELPRLGECRRSRVARDALLPSGVPHRAKYRSSALGCAAWQRDQILPRLPCSDREQMLGTCLPPGVS
ncbi:MAG: hypothetical protein H0V18_17170 [Pyrinomonadaceae bacterium]|nr:hypothetical protein [Pyrinomonadaceae bacterium]